MSDDALFVLMRDGLLRIERRLDGIDTHLSALNGSVARHETEITLMRHKTSVHAQEDREARTDRLPAFTRGDVKRAAAWIALGIALVEATRSVSTWLHGIQAVK